MAESYLGSVLSSNKLLPLRETNQTFLGQPQAVLALQSVQQESYKVMGTKLFRVDMLSTMDAEHFRQIQSDQLKSAIQILKRSWIDAIRNGVKQNLDSLADDNELSLEIKDKATYETSKMKSFVTTIKYVIRVFITVDGDCFDHICLQMMEDFSCQLIEESCKEYSRFFKVASSYDVEIHGTKDVRSTYVHPFNSTIKERIPLFSLELCPKDGAFDFSVPVDTFTNDPVKIFDEAIEMLQDIPLIETGILKRMFMGKPKHLKVLAPDSEFAKSIRNEILEDVKKACSHLRQYIRQYDDFLEFMNMDLTEYVRSYEEKETSLSEDEHEIEERLREKQKIIDEIPTFITAGMFHIKLESVNKFLSQKCDTLIRMIMSLSAEKAASKSKTVNEKYTEVYERLQVPYKTIEDIVELEEYIKEIPKETNSAHEILEEMLSQFEFLDRFSFQLTDEQFSDKWNAYG
eukprot:746504-Hanusia_phi.AAC.15